MYTGRQFMIFLVSEPHLIDFSQVLETLVDIVRRSVDGLKTFVKWDGGSVPSSVEAMTSKEGPYTYEEMLDILATPEWTDPNQMP